MKTLAFVFLSLFLTKSCQSKKDMVETASVAETVKTEEVNPEVKNNKTQQGMKIEYGAMSRGFGLAVVFENNQIIVTSRKNNQDKVETVKLSKDQIGEILTLVKEVDLKELPNLKSPTEKRMYDGAAHANLYITVDGVKHQGDGFDHGFPPKQIEKLVLKLVSYSEEK